MVRSSSRRRRRRRQLRRGGLAAAALAVLGIALVVFRLAGNDPAADAERALSRARGFAAEGDFKSAVIEYKNVVSLRPDHAPAREALGRAYLELEAYAPALKELEKARQLGARSDALEKTIVTTLAELGRTDDALARIDALVERGVDVSELEVIQARARLRQGELQAAREGFGRVLERTPDSVDALLGLARLSASEGDYDAANAKADETLAQDPDNAEAWLLKGQLALAGGDPAGAADALDRAAASSQPAIRLAALAALIRAQLLAEDIDAAQAALARAGDAAETAPGFMFYRALIAYLRDDREAADRAFTELLNIQPDHPRALLLSSQLRYGDGDYEVAQERLTRLVEMAPDYLPARRLLAATQLARNRPDSALTTLEYLDPETVQDGIYLELMGSAHLALGDSDEGHALLERAEALGADRDRLAAKLAIGALVEGDVDAALARLETLGEGGPGAALEPVVIYALLREGRIDEARSAALELADGAPGDPVPLNLLALVAMRAGDLEAAEARLDEARALAPDFLATYMNRAELELIRGDIESARQVLEAALAVDEAAADVHLMRARVETLAGADAAALQALRTAAAVDPKALRARVLAARRLLAASRTEEALEYAREAQALAPEAPQVMLLAARAELAAGEVEAARPVFEDLRRRHPDAPGVRYLAAEFALIDGDPAGARAALASLLADAPGYRPALLLGFRLALGAGDADDAGEMLAAYRETAPETATSAMMAGQLASVRGRPDEAVAHFLAAFERRRASGTLLALWQARRRAGDRDGARALIVDWLEERPDDLAVRLKYAGALVADGDRAGAIAQYERVLEARGNNVVVLNNLAYLYQAAGDPRALGYAERAYEAAPALFQTQDTFGWLLVEAGELERGLELLRRAQAQAPANPEINYHYASALARAGSRDEARRLLTAALDSTEPFESRDAARELLELL